MAVKSNMGRFMESSSLHQDWNAAGSHTELRK